MFKDRPSNFTVDARLNNEFQKKCKFQKNVVPVIYEAFEFVFFETY